ncbi:MAG: sporulation protein [Myxococcota bacterium]|nr:sporulation protein [Myxococcota bacterium]
MGLFDMFGAGGGRIAIQPQSAHVTAGGAIAGSIGFQGGTRAQQITNITLKLVMDQTQMEMTQQGPRPRTQTRDVVPAHPVAGAFTSTPGQVQQFPFDLQLPPGLPNTTPNAVKYRLVVSADIDNEVDPGANVEIQVVGGSPVMGAGMPGVQGGMPGMQGAIAGAMGAAGMMGAAGAMMPGERSGMPMQPAMPMPPAPPQVGTPVLAQWQDGNWHPAIVVAMQNGMYGVDWTNPALGQSSWVHPQQLQPQQPAMPPPGMMGAPGMAPQPGFQGHGHASAQQQAIAAKQQMNQQHQAHQQHVDPYAAKKAAHDPYAKPAHDPYAAKKAAHDPHAKPAHDPYGKDPHAKHAAGGALAIGTPVLAQSHDGHWHPARVVALQNGMIGVDWDDAKLGQSSWVQPQQVRAK